MPPFSRAQALENQAVRESRLADRVPILARMANHQRLPRQTLIHSAFPQDNGVRIQRPRLAEPACLEGAAARAAPHAAAHDRSPRDSNTSNLAAPAPAAERAEHPRPNSRPRFAGREPARNKTPSLGSSRARTSSSAWSKTACPECARSSAIGPQVRPDYVVVVSVLGSRAGDTRRIEYLAVLRNDGTSMIRPQATLYLSHEYGRQGGEGRLVRIDAPVTS